VTAHSDIFGSTRSPSPWPAGLGWLPTCLPDGAEAPLGLHYTTQPDMRTVHLVGERSNLPSEPTRLVGYRNVHIGLSTVVVLNG
jgi:hypothetical protein